MPNIYEIPLTPAAQTFRITLSGVEYILTLQYRNNQLGGWTVDIADKAGNPLVQGIPLVTGANLLEQYPHLSFGGRLWVQTTDNPDVTPTYTNLGIGSHLYWVTD